MGVWFGCLRVWILGSAVLNSTTEAPPKSQACTPPSTPTTRLPSLPPQPTPLLPPPCARHPSPICHPQARQGSSAAAASTCEGWGVALNSIAPLPPRDPLHAQWEVWRLLHNRKVRLQLCAPRGYSVDHRTDPRTTRRLKGLSPQGRGHSPSPTHSYGRPS